MVAGAKVVCVCVAELEESVRWMKKEGKRV